MASRPRSFTSPLHLSRALAAVLLLASACGGDKQTETDGDGSSTTNPPTTEGATESATEGTTDPESPTDGEPEDTDYDAMTACDLTVVCEPFTHFFAESSAYHPEGEPLLPGEECLWAGLRDGTPGRYTYTTDHEFGNGNEENTFVIHVHGDRKVTFATAFNFNVDEDEFDQSGFRPAKTCALAEPAFFDGCLQSGDSDHDDCAWTDKWWTDCVEDGPKCE
jgi:hypothetical protein